MPKEARHCEERSDAAISQRMHVLKQIAASFATLIPRNDSEF